MTEIKIRGTAKERQEQNKRNSKEEFREWRLGDSSDFYLCHPCPPW
jgi:hypothetical protein